MTVERDRLRRRARELGVEWFYWDNEGHYHESDPEAVQRVVDVLEADYGSIGTRRRHAGDRRVTANGSMSARTSTRYTSRWPTAPRSNSPSSTAT